MGILRIFFFFLIGGILGFGDRWDLKRNMKIVEEKNKTRKIEERKIKK